MTCGVLQEAFKGLTGWWKTLLGSEAEQVKLSSRLATSPCIVTTSKYGMSANMERIMRAQVTSIPGPSFMSLRVITFFKKLPLQLHCIP